MKQTLL